MKRFFMLLVAALIVTTVYSTASLGQTVENASAAPVIDYSPLAVAIERSGLSYQKTAQGIWIVPISLSEDRENKENNTVNVIIQGNQAIVSFIILVSKIEDPISDKLKTSITDLNNNYLLVKFAYDNDAVFIKIDSLLGDVSTNSVNSYINILKQIALKESGGIVKLLNEKS